LGHSGRTGAETDHAAELSPGQKAQIFDILADEKKRIEKLRAERDERERLELESLPARLSLPPKDPMDKILRYETAIERQLYRAINELERLQRRRGGELVPPPINLEVSIEN
jgi:hypothetical protein